MQPNKNDTNFRSAFAESQTERPQSLVGLLKLPPSPQDDMCKGPLGNLHGGRNHQADFSN